MKTLKITAIAFAAFVLSMTPGASDQVFNHINIDPNGKVFLPGNAVLGNVKNGVFSPNFPAGSVPGSALNPASPTALGGSFSSSAPTHAFSTGDDGAGNKTYRVPASADISDFTPTVRKLALPILTPYTGVVATRLIMPEGYQDTTIKDGQYVTTHFARDDIPSVSVCYANYYGKAGSGETNNGAPLTAITAIEYPIGTMTALPWGGNTQGTIAAGTYGCTDKVTLPTTIPNGARFNMHVHLYNANGLFTDTFSIPTATTKWTTYDRSKTSATAQTDETMSAYPSDMNTVGTAAYPILILGTTTKASVFLDGDSIVRGINDQIDDTTGDQGTVARSIGPYMAYSVNAISGENITPWLTGGAVNRLKMLQYFSAFVTDIGGVNDLPRTSAAVIADIHTQLLGIRALYPNIRLFENTRLPVTNSTDGYATTANQTALSPQYFQDINTDVKASVYADSFFDIAGALASPSDPTKFTTPPATSAVVTADGKHPNLLGNQLIAKSGNIPPGAFTRAGGAPPSLPFATTTPTVTYITTGGSTYTANANPIAGNLYTPPLGAKWIELDMCGAGGGGSGSGSAFVAAMAGLGGGGTTLGSLGTLGGNGAPSLYAAGTPGGLPAGFDLPVAGNPGGAGSIVVNAGPGPNGGNSGFLAGGGVGQTGAAGANATSNSGGGGAGGGYNTGASSPINTGGGGGGGACGRKVLTSLASTYTFAIGTGGPGGAAGTSGSAGGAGAGGYIRIVEHYGQ